MDQEPQGTYELFIKIVCSYVFLITKLRRQHGENSSQVSFVHRRAAAYKI